MPTPFRAVSAFNSPCIRASRIIGLRAEKHAKKKRHEIVKIFLTTFLHQEY
jgi:hypothetical protein